MYTYLHPQCTYTSTNTHTHMDYFSAPDDEDYLQQLKEDPGFLNPSSNDNLKLVLGIHSTGSGVPLVPGKKPTLIKNFQKSLLTICSCCGYFTSLFIGKNSLRVTTAML